MSFSQDLTPLLKKQENDTLFCFTIEQSRLIAKIHEKGRYDKLLLVKTNQENHKLKQLAKTKDTIIKDQHILIAKKDTIIDNTSELLALSDQNLKATQKQLKKKKTKNVFLTVGLAIVSIVAIVK